MAMKKRSRTEVGLLVQARRLELQRTPSDVIADAEIDAKTYASLEDGTRWPQERTRLKVERALRWKPGSIGRALNGEDPVAVENEPDADLASRVMHPSRRMQIADLVASDDGMAQMLERLVTHGRVDEADRARIEEALDDIRIAKFPELFESLSRPGKLQVVDFGSTVLSAEFLANHKEENNVVETTKKSAAPSAGNENKEDLDGPKTRTPLPPIVPTPGDIPSEDSGEDGSDDADEAHEL